MAKTEQQQKPKQIPKRSKDYMRGYWAGQDKKERCIRRFKDYSEREKYREEGRNEIRPQIEQAKQQTALMFKKEIDDLQEFFEADMWYASQNEWKTEEQMSAYLKKHFDIARGLTTRKLK